MQETQKIAYDINSFCQTFSIGRTKTYEEIKKGKLKTVKCGARTLIKSTDAEAWLNSLSSSHKNRGV